MSYVKVQGEGRRGWITATQGAKLILWVLPSIKGKDLWFTRLLYLTSLALLGVYYPKFGRYAVYDWFGVLAVVSGFGYYITHARFPVLNLYVLLSGILLVLGAIATIPNDTHPFHSAFAAILMLYTLVLWLSLPRLLFVEWKHLYWAFVALGVSVSVTSIYAIGQKLLGFPVLGPNYFWGREIGLTRQPNEIGTFCAMVFPYLLSLTITSRILRNKIIWTGVAMLAIIGVLLSGSMTGALALLAGILGYYFTTSRRGRVRTVILILLGTIVITVFSAVYSGKHTQFVVQRIERFISSQHGKITLDQRLVANRHAWQYIQSSPLQGHGYHSRVKSIGGSIQVHNTILRAWYDGGIFTLLAVLMLLLGAAIALAKAWKQIVYIGDIRHKPYVAGAIGAFIAFLVTIQASPVLYQRSTWFPVALAFAVALIVRRTKTAVRHGE